MTELKGFYRLVFSAQLPGAGGVAVLNDGIVHGGDTHYLYAGTFGGDADALWAKLRVLAHSGAGKIAFEHLGGAFDLDLKGAAAGTGFKLMGPSPLPHSTITVGGWRMATLDLR